MTDYFVKNGGNDGADGLSDANAWETVGKVNGESYSAGDIINLKANSNWDNSSLILPSSGAPGNPIIVRPYDTGDMPRVSGWVDILGTVGVTWTDIGSNQWTRAFTPAVASALTGGLVLFDSGSGLVAIHFMEATQAAVTQTGEWHYASSVLTVYSTSDPASAFAAMRAFSQTNALNLTSRDWIDIEDIEFYGGQLNTIIDGSDNLNFTRLGTRYSGTGRLISIDNNPCDSLYWKDCNSEFSGGFIAQDAAEGDDFNNAHCINFDEGTNCTIDGGNWRYSHRICIQRKVNATDALVVKNANIGPGYGAVFDMKTGNATVDNCTLQDSRNNAAGNTITLQSAFNTLTITNSTIKGSTTHTAGNVHVQEGTNNSGSRIIARRCTFVAGIGSGINVNNPTAATPAHIFENCLFYPNPGGSVLNRVLYFNNGAGTVAMDYCTVVSNNGADALNFGTNTFTGKVTMRQCLVVNLDNGFPIDIDFSSPDLDDGTDGAGETKSRIIRVTGTTFVQWDATAYDSGDIGSGNQLETDHDISGLWVTATADPFTDSVNDDYTLTGEDAGADIGVSVDILGNTRVNFTMGAYEFAPAAAGNPWYYYASM